MNNDSPFYSGYSHSCDVGIACVVGLEAAHVFNHIVYWLRHNAKINKAKIINDRHWMYESQKEISDSLGYLSEDQVCRAIKKLLEAGYLIAENHNDNKFKKTNWYAIFDDNIYLNDLENKKIVTKPRNRGIVTANSRDQQRESAESIYVQEEYTYKEQQQQAASPAAASFDKEKQEKIKELKRLPLSAGIIESSLFHLLPDIKNAIEHCLNRIESIKDIDAYFHEALSKKWLPRPNKSKTEKLSEEVKKKEQQQKQKLYAEAVQLPLCIKFKEGYSIVVHENHIVFGTPKGFHPEPLSEKSIGALREFIKLYKK